MLAKMHRVVDLDAIRTAHKNYCEACHRYGPTEAHHVVTRGAGGPDHPLNLVALCKASCHRRAHSGWLSKQRLFAIIGQREKMSPEAVEERVREMQRGES